MNQLSPEKIKLIEEIFDAHSYHINDDLDSLQYVAGSSVIVNKVDFTKAVAEILSKIKGSEWMSVEDARKMICSAYNEGMYDMNRGSQGNPCHYESGTDYAIKILPIPSKPLNQ